MLNNLLVLIIHMPNINILIKYDLLVSGSISAAGILLAVENAQHFELFLSSFFSGKPYQFSTLSLVILWLFNAIWTVLILLTHLKNKGTRIQTDRLYHIQGIRSDVLAKTTIGEKKSRVTTPIVESKPQVPISLNAEPAPEPIRSISGLFPATELKQELEPEGGEQRGGKLATINASLRVESLATEADKEKFKKNLARFAKLKKQQTNE